MRVFITKKLWLIKFSSNFQVYPPLHSGSQLSYPK